jgi:selenocysteine lyase/cysteine desulfurase/DNA-binding CsgD family transcriptional regulator
MSEAAPRPGSPEPPLVGRARHGTDDDGVLTVGPFGPRRITHAGYAASGQSLDLIEDFLRDAVLPRYDNAAGENDRNAPRAGRLHEDARRIIRNAVGGTADDLVIFCGSGAAAAVNKLIGILELRIPAGLDERYGLSANIPAHERPAVFVSPFAHHSSALPWRESVADVVAIGEDADGYIDLAELDCQLDRYADRPLLIGSFSAASSVTGVLSDTGAVATLLHSRGALSFWDYAAAGPDVDIRVSASAPGADDHKDAVFLSPHNFPGTSQTPGVLIVRRELVPNEVPAVPGGGTMVYADPAGHRYFEEIRNPLARGRALEDAAVLAAAEGDGQIAREAVAVAVGLYRSLDAHWDIRRAAARLRPFGIRADHVPASVTRPARGWEALTPTEIKVARLVASGRSNPEVAEELFLSRNTVQTHVSHILAKLGARSRAEIIRQALMHS